MIRIGVDFGGTKIEAAALDRDGRLLSRVRAANPRDYDAALQTVKTVVQAAENEAGAQVDRVGVGMPGSISPATGLVRNANSTFLNGRAFDRDLERVLARRVRVENDANCFALSEATDGAAAGLAIVFGVIIGTGCGGGLVASGRSVNGRNAIAGEWGHMPLPWPEPTELQAHRCWCGRSDCMETWVSGTALQADYSASGGGETDGATIVQRAGAGEPAARAALGRYIDRLARGLAVICDILDPDAIVLGGGLSNVDELYGERLTRAIAARVFSDYFTTPVLRPLHGDSSGVRGAAWLWPWAG